MIQYSKNIQQTKVLERYMYKPYKNKYQPHQIYILFAKFTSMDYQNTSHVSSWNFTTSDLAEIRTKANNRARHLIMKEFERRTKDKSTSINKKEQQQQEQPQYQDEHQEQHQEQQQQPPPQEVEENSSQQPTSEKQYQSLSNQLPVSFAMGYSKKSKDTYTMDIDQDEEDNEHQKIISTTIQETDELPFLSPTEELTLVQFYATKLFSLIGPNAQHPPLKRDIKIPSTAALLFKRFYLSNSVMIYDPKIFMVSSAFLASKIEDLTVDIRHLEKGTEIMKAHVSIPDIIKAEIQLIEGIHYDLLCFHPYRSVESYTEDMRIFLKSKEGKKCVNRESVGSADLRPLYEEAKRVVEEFVSIGDAMLTATAGKIGLASLKLANERLMIAQQQQQQQLQEQNGSTTTEDDTSFHIDFKGYLKTRFGSNYNSKEIDKVWNDIETLCNDAKNHEDIVQTTTDMSLLKAIHKKLKKCRSLGSGKGGDGGGGDEKKKKKKKRKRDE